MTGKENLDVDVGAYIIIITGYTALHRAASWGHPDCLRVLVTNGADLQIQNAHGERAREAAARYQKDSCVDYLDRAGTHDQKPLLASNTR